MEMQQSMAIPRDIACSCLKVQQSCHVLQIDLEVDIRNNAKVVVEMKMGRLPHLDGFWMGLRVHFLKSQKVAG